MKPLPMITHENKSYFVDFWLKELRAFKPPLKIIKFTDITDNNLKSVLRGLRASYWRNVYINGLD